MNISAEAEILREDSSTVNGGAEQYQVYGARETSKLGTQGIVEVWDLDHLTENPLNPRGIIEDDPAVRELADSIREKGLLEPLLITPAGRIIAGHRRRRACELAGVVRVRVIVQNLSEKDQLEVMLVENLQREPLNPLQEALAYQGLLERGSRVADIIRRTGVARDKVTAHLKLLKLPNQVQQWIARGRLPFSVVGLLLAIDDEAQCIFWAEKAVLANWSKLQLAKALGAGVKRRPTKSEWAPSNAPGPIVTRLISLESLRRCKGWPLTLEVLERALNNVSCSCSVEAKPERHSELCKNCPLAHFLAAVARETYDATN